MTKVSTAIDRLKAVADFQPELEGDDVEAEIQETMDSFLTKYPQLRGYADTWNSCASPAAPRRSTSTSISRSTASAETWRPRSTSRGCSSIGGRWFHFADAVYPSHPDPIHVFAFDLQSGRDLVCRAANEVWDYSLCADSFTRLLEGFAEGVYPGLTG